MDAEIAREELIIIHIDIFYTVPNAHSSMSTIAETIQYTPNYLMLQVVRDFLSNQ